MRKIEVYYNLHKHLFSVRALDGVNKGRVIAHSETAYLVNPKFVVQPRGRQRVLEEQRKNVHAFVRGFQASILDRIPDKSEMTEVTYNPYKYDSFVRKSDATPILHGGFAVLADKKIWVKDGQFA